MPERADSDQHVMLMPVSLNGCNGKLQAAIRALNLLELVGETMRRTLDAIAEIAPEELKRRQDAGDKIFVLDVREPYEYQISNIGGHLIPLGELPAEVLHERPDGVARPAEPGAVHDARGNPETAQHHCHSRCRQPPLATETGRSQRRRL